MQDKLMILRDGNGAVGHFDADEAAAAFTAVKLGSTPPGTPWFLRVNVPQTSGAANNDTVVVKLSGCHTADGSFVDLVTTPALSAKGVYNYAFTSDYEYYKIDLNGTDTADADGFDFGHLFVEVTPYARAPHDMPVMDYI